MATLTQIAPCLWFDTQAEAAAKFYVSVFDDSAIDAVSHYGKEGFEIHGRAEGSVMTVDFCLSGQRFTALNGGAKFKFDESVSFQVYCHTQEEVDRFWDRLSEGGKAGPCGWLKDQFGLSWQIVPATLRQMMCDPDAEKTQRVMRAVLQMTKPDLAALQRAYDGQ